MMSFGQFNRLITLNLLIEETEIIRDYLLLHVYSPLPCVYFDHIKLDTVLSHLDQLIKERDNLLVLLRTKDY